ncbi:hypothetical protein MNEG_8377, partial [Monoraphidium neglectum]
SPRPIPPSPAATSSRRCRSGTEPMSSGCAPLGAAPSPPSSGGAPGPSHPWRRTRCRTGKWPACRRGRPGSAGCRRTPSQGGC